MVKLKQYAQLFRLPNLVIVLVTQYLLQYLVVYPLLALAGQAPLLDLLHFSLLSFVTVLITAGGFLVNDLLDAEADLINKPDKTFINRLISKRKAWLLYWALNLIGLVVAVYLALYIRNLKLLLIYPSAVLLLFLYSKYFKKWPLVGNVVVAVFCAFVAGIVFFAEREFLSHSSAAELLSIEHTKIYFSFFLSFAFFTTLVREIVKDAEDLEGDSQLGLHTLPIRFGIPTARIIAFVALVVLLLVVGFFAKWLFENEKPVPFAFSLVGVVLPLLLIGRRLLKASEKTDFTRLSKGLKWMMLAGLALLILC